MSSRAPMRGMKLAARFFFGSSEKSPSSSLMKRPAGAEHLGREEHPGVGAVPRMRPCSVGFSSIRRGAFRS